MYRIRFHGRGGQGIKTASRILGTTLFLEGLEVQDAPRYGAERRGAPIFAYVRASTRPIQERGIIPDPDLVVVADETLIAMSTAGVLAGFDENTVLLMYSNDSAETWQQRLNLQSPVLVVNEQITDDVPEQALIGAICAGAAARLLGCISRQSLIDAITEEISPLGSELLEKNLKAALASFDQQSKNADLIKHQPGPTSADYQRPDWLDLPFEEAHISAPDIFAELTSVQVNTSLWRTLRPVIEYDLCNACSWICSTFCPDSCIEVDAQGLPQIDYDHCKGCLVCVGVCPPHAIISIPEKDAQEQEQEQK